MKPASFLLAFAILAGCTNDEPNDADPRGGRQLFDADGEPDLFLIRGPEHATIRAFMDDTTLGAESNKEWCAEDADEFDTFTAYLKIWNRTGLAVYQAKAFTLEQETYMDFTMDLPGDPPYLIAAGAYCFRNGYSIEIESPNGEIDAESLDIHPTKLDVPPSESDSLLDLVWYYGTVTVSALETEGVGFIETSPAMTEVLAGFFPSMPKEGSTRGVFEGYEPNGTPGQDQWLSHVETGGLTGTTTWTLDRYFAAMPGDYPMRLTLPQPHPVETVWTNHLEVYEITPKAEELGFQQPFRDYTECAGQATDASGLLDCSP